VRSWLLFAAVVVLLLGAAWLRGRRGRQPMVAVLVVIAAAVVAVWGVVEGYDLRKLAAALVMPAGLIWSLLGALAWRLSGLRLRPMAVAAWVLWLGFGLAGNGWVSRLLNGWLESAYERVDPLTLAPFDAVLVLGGGVGQHPNGQVTLGDSGDRLALAARLYHTGRTPLLVTTGPLFPVGEPPTGSIPRLTARVWRELGVPDQAMVLVEGPTATREEVAALTDLVRERGWGRVGLVTSARHLRRAARLCRRAGLEVVPLPADFAVTVSPARPASLVPSGEGMADIQGACWELVGAAVGR
jgi:uncharacterized SAM-binding protein YcdF (DUF218 family)